MSYASRLVATGRACGLKLSSAACRRLATAPTHAHALYGHVDSKVWQVGEAGPSTWQSTSELVNTSLAAQCEAVEDTPLTSGAGRAEDSVGRSREARSSAMKRPKTLPAEAKALLDALDSVQPPSHTALRDWIQNAKKSKQGAYMLVEIGRHLGRELKAYAAVPGAQGSPWTPYRRALLQLLWTEGASVEEWHDERGRLRRHHPLIALLNQIARQARFEVSDKQQHSRHASILLETINRQLPSTLVISERSILSVLSLLPSQPEYHLVKALLLTDLLDYLDQFTPASSKQNISQEQLVQLRKAITFCTPAHEWKHVPHSLHQVLLKAWKVVLDQSSELETLSTYTSDQYTPTFLSLLLKMPGGGSMELPELIDAMRKRNLPITPAQTQMVLRYESFLAPRLQRPGDLPDQTAKIWEGLMVRRQMHAAVEAHTSGVASELKSLELTWGEIALSSYEVIHALMQHGDGGALEVDVQAEENFWAAQLADHEQTWRADIQRALTDAEGQPRVETFAPANKQGQALWLLLRHRLIFGRQAATSSDPLKNPRFLFSLSIGSGPRTKMQHIRAVSCLVRLLLHYRSDVTQLIPCLHEAAGDKSLELPALLHQRILAACTTCRHLRTLLPVLLELQVTEPVTVVSRELRRLVRLASDAETLKLFLQLLDHWQVSCPVDKVPSILRDRRVRAELVEMAVSWEATRAIRPVYFLKGSMRVMDKDGESEMVVKRNDERT